MDAPSETGSPKLDENSNRFAETKARSRAKNREGDEEEVGNRDNRAGKGEEADNVDNREGNGRKIVAGKADAIVRSVSELVCGKDETEWTAEDWEWIDGMRSRISSTVNRDLADYFFFNFRSGERYASPLRRPDWFDASKFRRGQRFATEHFICVAYGQLLGLYLGYTFEHTASTLVFSGKSHTPYLAFKRYLATLWRVRNWFTEDPFEEGTSAFKDIQEVRRMHSNVRRKLHACGKEAYVAGGKLESPHCPILSGFVNDMRQSNSEHETNRGIYQTMNEASNVHLRLNQAEMSAAQFSFMVMVVLFPERMGIHGATDDDLEAFCHVWRGLGYLLGIEDECNFCRGSLEEVKRRSRNFIDYAVKPRLELLTPEWEHMLRCVDEGLKYFFPFTDFDKLLYSLLDICGLESPSLYESLTYSQWIRFHAEKLFFRYAFRIPFVVSLLNDWLNHLIDGAITFSPEKEAELRERSANTMELWSSTAKIF